MTVPSLKRAGKEEEQVFVGGDAPTPVPTPSWLRIPWIGIGMLALFLALFFTIIWLASALDPPVASTITFPPGIDPAQRNATLATLRTTCVTQCRAPLVFVNFVLVEVDDVPNVAPGTTYPACICRAPDDTLTRITLRVARP